MRIEFKRIGNEYVTETGLKVPLELICGNAHDLLPNGSGWVDVNLPFLVGPNVPEEGAVKVVGFGSAPAIKTGDGKVIPAPGLKDPTHGLTIPERPATTAAHVIDDPSRPRPFQLTSPDQSQEIITTQPLVNLDALGDATDVFPDQYNASDILKIFQQQGVQFYPSIEDRLRGFGFDPRPNKNGSVHRWYHPVFGDDKVENWLLFDPETDVIESLVVKVFRHGAYLGTRALKMQIKNTIESH